MNDSEISRIVNRGAIGIAYQSGQGAFYVNMMPLLPVGAVPGLEITFNPERVVIDGYETDVIVQWGALAEVSLWLSDLLRDLSVELCPIEIEDRVRRALFGDHSKDVVNINPRRPWSFLS